VNYHFVECIHTEKDQGKSIQNEEVGVILNKTGKYDIGYYPYYEKYAGYGNKRCLFSIEQSPVVKKPEEEKEINIRIHIQHKGKRIRMSGYI
jgi:hypothetical protein